MNPATSTPLEGLCPTSPARAATLAATSPGQWGIVLRLNTGADPSVAARLMDMGIVPGTTICRLRAGSRRGPLLVRLRGYLLGLGHDEAACVEVAPGSAPPL